MDEIIFYFIFVNKLAINYLILIIRFLKLVFDQLIMIFFEIELNSPV